jgi:hypothetical protein
MPLHRSLPVALALAAALATALHVRDAAACGGFFSEQQSVDVASHRMIISISQTQSTLYDEIQYTGNPASFAWVLPVMGNVTVGLSSDALFNVLDQQTVPIVTSPFAECQNLSNCQDGCETASSSGTGGGPEPDGGSVNIVSQMVVGPYQTVQLSSTDPTALTSWLNTNGYTIPTNIQPIISAYVSGGFNFLALKLVPGAGTSAMRPVSVTTPGASVSLPLRMVAAGAPTTVPITLFVLGEGRYQPTNFPFFTIDPTKLVWDFGSETSNYSTLQAQGFAAQPNAWQVESAQPSSEQQITNSITILAQNDPTQSGYGGADGGAPMAAQTDLDTLFSGIDSSSLWITRLFAQMPSTALTSDLTVGASTDQTLLSNFIQATQSVGCIPCPNPGPCSDASSSTASSGAGGASTASGATHGATNGATSGAGGTGGTGAATGGGKSSGGSSCTVSGEGSGSLALGGVLGALGLAFARRRRARSR